MNANKDCVRSKFSSYEQTKFVSLAAAAGIFFCLAALPARGADTGSIIAVTGNLDFGNVATGATKTAAMTITNSGDTDLTVTNINYPDCFNGAWSGIISPNSASNVTVIFAPAALSNYVGTITVQLDAIASNGTIACSGNGVASIIGVSGNLAFGNVTMGAVATNTLTITNAGNIALTVTNIDYPSRFSGAWTGIVSPGGASNVTVSFAPVALTNYGGTISVQSDAVDGDGAIMASGTGTAVQATLTVISAHGGTNPGTVTLSIGTSANQWITNSPVVAGTTQYVCNGGIVSGNDSTQHNLTNITLNLTNNASLTWLWTTNFLLQAASAGGGTATPTGGWCAAGSVATVTATPNANMIFAGWSGNVPTAKTKENPLTLNMDGARSIVANFTQQLANVIVLASPQVAGTTTGGGPHPTGSSIVISASPNIGWMFSAWNDADTHAVRTITVPTSNITYTATFTHTKTRGDIDGDGRGDLIMRNDTNGVMTLLSMNGYAVLSQTNLFGGQSIGGFELAATSDLDADGIEDIILNYQGLHFIVFMGSNTPIATLLGGNISPWHVVAGGDYDGDGHGDLVFQAGDKDIFSMALMNGTNVLAADYLWGGTDISPWHIIGGGDFDGDGKADLVIQDGANATYGIVNMDGMTMTNANYVMAGTLTDLWPFNVSAVTDLNGDHHSALVLTSAYDNRNLVLYMSNSTAIAGAYINDTPTNNLPGRIVGPR